MTIGKIHVNGIEMRYQEIPNEGKEGIVFLHYGGATLAIWNGVIPFFKDNYHIIAADLRGHGFTEKPAADYHPETMAKDISELMAKLGVEKAHIVGSSLGADVALALGALFPEKVLSLSLDGGYYDLAGPNSKEQYLTQEQIKQAMDEFKERILSREKKFFDTKEELIAYQKAVWEKYFPWTDVARIAIEDDILQTEDGKFTGCQTQESIWKYCEPLYDFRIMDYYKDIKVPVLFLPDEKESQNEIVQKTLEKIKKELDHSKVVIIEGSVHAYTCLIKPQELSNVILQFIEEISP